MSDNEFQSWIKEKLPYFELMSSQISYVLENLLKQNGINYLSIESRTKSLDNIQEKIKRKFYKKPIEQLTDIAGIRIILYLENDVDSVCEIIRKTFDIDVKNSSNNSTRLAIDKIGYRSIHFVCDIGNKRSSIPEYQTFGGLKFEIQVRTILQHSWANLTHDRVYKFGNNLPESIKRKVNLYSGMLEIVDLGFSEIVNEVNSYRKALSFDEIENIENDKIDSINIIEYMSRICKENNYSYIDLDDNSSFDDVIDELKFFGVESLSDVKNILPNDFFDNLKKYNIETTILGLLRDSMLIKDYKKLSLNEGVTWNVCYDEDEEAMLRPFYNEYMSEEKIDDMIFKFGLQNKNIDFD